MAATEEARSMPTIDSKEYVECLEREQTRVHVRLLIELLRISMGCQGHFRLLFNRFLTLPLLNTRLAPVVTIISREHEKCSCTISFNGHSARTKVDPRAFAMLEGFEFFMLKDESEPTNAK